MKFVCVGRWGQGSIGRPRIPGAGGGARCHRCAQCQMAVPHRGLPRREPQPLATSEPPALQNVPAAHRCPLHSVWVQPVRA